MLRHTLAFFRGRPPPPPPTRASNESMRPDASLKTILRDVSATATGARGATAGAGAGVGAATAAVTAGDFNAWRVSATTNAVPTICWCCP